MAFATDRDLLIYEPGVFSEASWSAQRLVSVGDASVTGNTLSSTKADFEAARVEGGHVVIMAGVTLEVVERLSATSLIVSPLRADRASAPLAPAPSLSGDATIHSFAPQIELAHREILRRARVAPAGEPGEVEASAILNGDAFRPVEALGALRLVYAASATGADSMARLKADMHRDRFARALHRLRIELDLDGDGAVDETRRLNATQLERA